MGVATTAGCALNGSRADISALPRSLHITRAPGIGPKGLTDYTPNTYDVMIN